MIVLTRHAQTTGGTGRCIGQTPLPLSDTGVAQTYSLADTLCDAGFVRLCTSPSLRAIATITPLADRLDMAPDIIPELNEINMGTWDGLPFEDIRSRFSKAYTERGTRFDDFRPPNGESFNDVADRALTALNWLATGPQPVFVVAHAGVIRSVLCRVTNHPMDDLFHFTPSHAHCTLLEPTPKGLKLIATEVSPAELPTLS